MREEKSEESIEPKLLSLRNHPDLKQQNMGIEIKKNKNNRFVRLLKAFLGIDERELPDRERI